MKNTLSMIICDEVYTLRDHLWWNIFDEAYALCDHFFIKTYPFRDLHWLKIIPPMELIPTKKISYQSYCLYPIYYWNAPPPFGGYYPKEDFSQSLIIDYDIDHCKDL